MKAQFIRIPSALCVFLFLGISTVGAETYPAPVSALSSLALSDTIYLMGGPDRQDGDFQNDINPTIADDEGWLPPYLIEPLLWHIDTVNAELLDPGQAENHAMWCGKYYPPCWGEDEAHPGYGNNLEEWLEWAGRVGDPGLPTEVRLTAVLNHDTEPGYDYLYFEVAGVAGYTNIQDYNGANHVGGVFTPVNVDLVFTVDPADYLGAGGDEIHLRWRFRSDGGFSDQDCAWPTVGAAQIDNIAVSFDQGGGPLQQTFDDFEAGSPVHWSADRLNNCGFAKVWPILNHADSCEPINNTPQLAFIDDGTQCDDMPTFGSVITYGPDGMVVVAEGVPYSSVAPNEFWSPAMELPDNTVYESVNVEFDAYLDHARGFVRISTSSDGGISWSGMSSVAYGGSIAAHRTFASEGPLSKRYSAEFHSSIRDSTDMIRISLGFYKNPRNVDWLYDSPTPYFDNVSVKVYRNSGPIFAEVRPEYLVPYISDRFPSVGLVDTTDLAAAYVNLDPVEREVSLPRVDSALVSPPELHWVLNPNPLFDPYRNNLPSNPIVGDYVDDSWNNGFPTDTWRFSFPGEGFIYPGDELHYFFRAQDDVAGDIGTTIQPADTTGFSSFDSSQTGVANPYPQRFIFRALPTLSAAHPDSQPKILIWDGSNIAAETEDLVLSLFQLGYRQGQDYDLLRSYTLDRYSPSTAPFGYTTIISSRGPKAYYAESTLVNWLGLGGRNLLLSGNNIGGFSDGTYPYTDTLTGAVLEDSSVGPFIGDQLTPGLAATSVVPGITVPLVAHGCDYPKFDAMALSGTGQALYEYDAPDGSPGGYQYPAAIYNYAAVEDARTITVPIAFSRLVSPHHFGGGLPARTVFLDQVLTFFGHSGTHAPSTVPVVSEFSVKAYPNPFNPRTTIAFNLPQKSAVELDIYDLAGRRVATLLSGEELESGPNAAVWTGRDTKGRSVAAGVYFYRLKAGPNVAVERVTLVK